MINNSQTILAQKEALQSLNKKYSSYLLSEGKWLIGGFESLIHVEKNIRLDESNVTLKKEIFMMLPVEIREEISKIIPID
ncbi:hypothetical protein ACFRAE_00780 [Sphingobacterium sp. HJSM2_6]|uniref:hypothetical protein n=1 Tax=Sphingobacterium sp. HJSM2_6 TaxID=3366264 RepID=UPI003BD22771